MENYDPKFIEAKWQKRWEEQGLFKTPEDVTPENKMYILPQLPYPSGSGLHVGHAEVYTACDIYARYQRMKGKKVLQVMGWDAFGLPAENYAIKTNIHPRLSTNKAINTFREQIKSLGISVDWDREVGSHQPDYYKWTQWFFLLMYKRGLAYRKKQSVNWCDSCKTVLANEQVTAEGQCERCETAVSQRQMEQWFLKITEYADRLLDGLDRIDWPEETKRRQKNWIGQSEGAEVEFRVQSLEFGIKVFTTRPDTIFGATYLVLAPEHELIENLKSKIKNQKFVVRYIQQTKLKTELDRQTQKEKTGVELKGVKAINPANGEEIPVWIADYVLATYGTGAVMAVPAHDERDFEFAIKFGLPIRVVVNDRVGKYLVIEKSLSGQQIKRLEDFGTVAVEKETKNWGKFYRVNVPHEKEQEFLLFLSENLLETSDDGGSWYADSMGSTNMAVFHGKALSVFDEHGLESFKAHGRTEHIPEEQLDINFRPFTADGVSVNSGFLTQHSTPEAKVLMIKWLEEHGVGRRRVQYKLRDWSVSRQRFWGAPIPMMVKEQESVSSERQPDYVINLHAWGSEPQGQYHPWVDKQLQELGIAVHTPALPNAEEPEFADWLTSATAVLPKDTTNCVITGRSLGCWTALKLAELYKLRKLILVAPVTATQAWFDKIEGQLDSERARRFVGGIEGNIDFTRVRENVQEVVVFLSTDDPYIPLGETEVYFEERLPSCRVIRQRDSGHFDVEHGYATFPGLLEEILKSIYPHIRPLRLEDLPILLPDDVDFRPTGESPLNYSKEFQKGVEKKYGKGWKREVDTLDTFMCSSWYYYRYLDPHNDQAFASPAQLKTWMPVDFYLGGEEHVNGHLLYARFFTKVLYDAGYIDFDEPFAVHRHQGLILGEDHRKMSKRWNNVINPTEVVNEFGADTMRLYEMFMGPLADTKPWSTAGVRGARRFLERVWRLQSKVKSQKLKIKPEMESLVHKIIKKVGEDLTKLQFNTAIAKMMELVNAFTKDEKVARSHFEIFLKLLSPFAPHMCEEMWANLGYKTSICSQSWPTYDKAKLIEETVTLVAQVNGRVRASFVVPADISGDEAKKRALAEENVQKWLGGKEPKKVIYVTGKLVSIVV